MGCTAVLSLASLPAGAVPHAIAAYAAVSIHLHAPVPTLLLAQAPVARFAVSEIAGQPGAEIPVRVSIPAETTTPVHIMLVRGLPAGFALSKAVRIDDAWAISPQQLSRFSLLPPRDYEGSFELQFVLVWGPERTRDIRTVAVSIGSQATTERERIEPGAIQSSAEAAAPSPAPATSPETRQIAPEEERAMLDRALAILQNGDIAAARLLFQRLADKGSARGALAMAKTYDPEVLTGMSVFGLVPEPQKAAEWYARAAAMGSEQARERLATLNARAVR